MSYVAGAGFSWLPDASGLLVNLKPAALGKAPLATGIPSGPSTQDSQSNNGARQLRTYPDLLKNEEDARLFEHYATVQLALVDLAGKTRMVGAPDLFIGARLAPNGKYILTQALQRPFSYVVPASGFARRVDVRDLSGKAVHLVAEQAAGRRPAAGERRGVGRRARRQLARRRAGHAGVGRSAGRRRPGQAGRDPRHRLRAGRAVRRPSRSVLAKLGSRYNGIQWGRGDLALLSEGWYKTRAIKTWRIAPDQPATAPELVFAYSAEDRYNNPGRPVMQPDAAGLPRLLIGPDSTILLDGAGASNEGDRPFIDRFSLVSKKKERLFQSAAPYYENVGGGAERRRHAPADHARIADRAAELLRARPEARAARRS